MTSAIFVFNSILGTGAHRHRVHDAAHMGHRPLTLH
jgi:hypothetical protein